MSDTAQFATVFQAVDRLRLLQDIVLHLDHLTSETGFSDDGAREAWMTDPTLVPIRELVEHIYASEDWVEIVVVTTLVFEPIVGRLAKAELFTKRATLAGDATTPLVIAGALRDNDRHVQTVQALVQHVIADPETGAANAEIIRGWIAEWTPRAEAAAKALIFLPTAISMVAAAVMWRYIYYQPTQGNGQVGVLNTLVKPFGIDPLNWLIKWPVSSLAMIVVMSSLVFGGRGGLSNSALGAIGALSCLIATLAMNHVHRGTYMP